MAVAKVCNVYPDFTLRNVGGGIDLLIKNRGVDVKQTRYSNGQLLARIKRGQEIDGPEIFILVIGEFPEYRIVGWCWREELIKKENIKDLGHGATYALPQDQLRPWGLDG